MCIRDSDYTADSWKAVQTALTAAKSALSAKESQSAVDTAKDALNTAVKGLVKAPVSYTHLVCEPDEDEDFTAYQLSVTVTIENDKIVALSNITGDGDSQNASYIRRASEGTSKIKGVSAQILETGTLENIDTVSRATCSSKAILEACRNALDACLLYTSSGDPVWATLEVAGMGIDGRSIVTKNDFRFLHTLENMGPSPEPNLTVLYSEHLPEAFKKYAAHISVQTSSIQYENDDVMRPVWGDDYSICCCVSATETGKEIQFFGARANLAKCLLYAINGGKDEKTKQQVAPEYQPITGEYLDYDEVMKKYDVMMDWLAHLYVGTLNMIHYMHDKYYYEAAEMALIDTDVRRTFADVYKRQSRD